MGIIKPKFYHTVTFAWWASLRHIEVKLQMAELTEASVSSYSRRKQSWTHSQFIGSHTKPSWLPQHSHRQGKRTRRRPSSNSIPGALSWDCLPFFNFQNWDSSCLGVLQLTLNWRRFKKKSFIEGAKKQCIYLWAKLLSLPHAGTGRWGTIFLGKDFSFFFKAMTNTIY